MRARCKSVGAALLLLAVAGCIPELGENAGLGHPNQIIVRDFTVSPGVITLDPSFGFSLYRGMPGVPPGQRAASIGRAVAFSLADAIVQQLRDLGYEAVHSDSANAEPGGRALIVTGRFTRIDEGRRRRVGAENSGVAADAEIDYQAAGMPPRRLMAFPLDSRQAPGERIIGAAARHGADVNAAASRLGRAIARALIEVARHNTWPAASR